jgi:hypothetical protein
MSTHDQSAPVYFDWPVRVYYEDTDAAGVVFYANYLRFMERGRTEWLRALGFEQDQLRAEQGVVFAVTAVDLKYLTPARFNESADGAFQSQPQGRRQSGLRAGDPARHRSGRLLSRFGQGGVPRCDDHAPASPAGSAGGGDLSKKIP